MRADLFLKLASATEVKDKLLHLAAMMGHEILSEEEAMTVLANSDPSTIDLARGLLDNYLEDVRVAGAVKELASDPVMGALISLNFLGL